MYVQNIASYFAKYLILGSYALYFMKLSLSQWNAYIIASLTFSP